jgi:sugar phosphate isomerase/epimerase
MYSRRDFGKMALAGAPLTLFAARINSKVSGVELGSQSYSFRDRPLDDAIKAMSEIGLGVCELFSPHMEPGFTGMRTPPAGGGPGGGRGKQPEDPARAAARQKAREDLRTWRLTVSADEIRGVKKKFDDAGISLPALNLSFNDSFTDDEIDRGFVIAKWLGVKFITASSTISASKRVAPFADKHKMTVAMHGHSNTRDPNQFATPESFSTAMEMSKNFAINLDIGHFFAAGYDPVDYIQKNHDKILLLHLKDRKKDDGANMPWGEGDTPIKAVLQLLKKNKYPIPALIEYEYRGEDAIAEVKKCFQYCKDALA